MSDPPQIDPAVLAGHFRELQQEKQRLENKLNQNELRGLFPTRRLNFDYHRTYNRTALYMLEVEISIQPLQDSEFTNSQII